MKFPFNRNVELRVQVFSGGEKLQQTVVISEYELDEIAPARGPVDPFDFTSFQQRSERRQRMIDLWATTVARALSEAIFKQAGL